MTSKRLKADVRRHMAENPDAKYTETLRALTADGGGAAPESGLITALGISDIDTHDFGSAWRDAAVRNTLAFPLGVAHRPSADPSPAETVWVDLAQDHNPHMLIVGRTGSGKSVFLETMFTSLAALHGPDTVNFAFLDCKGASTFAFARSLPHTLVCLQADNAPVLTKQLGQKVGYELDARHRLLADKQCRGISEYRTQWAQNRGDDTWPPMPHLIVALDEYTPERENGITALRELMDRVTEDGGDVGVHLVWGLQRVTYMFAHTDIAPRMGCRVVLNPLGSRSLSQDTVGDPAAAERLMPGEAVCAHVQCRPPHPGWDDDHPVNSIRARSRASDPRHVDLYVRNHASDLQERITAAPCASPIGQWKIPDIDTRLAVLQSEVDTLPAALGTEIESVTAAVRWGAEMRSRGLHSGPIPAARTLVFSGPAGSGKRRAAEVIARLLSGLGMYASAHLVDVRPGQVTHTPPVDVVDDHRGEVLFIDVDSFAVPGVPQYSPATSRFDVEKIVNCVRQAEAHGGDTLLILSGTPVAIGALVEHSPDVMRAQTHIEFASASADELWRHLIRCANRVHRTVDAEAEGGFRQQIETLLDVDADGVPAIDRLGNYRFAEAVADLAMRLGTRRLAEASLSELTDDELTTLTVGDITAAVRQAAASVG
ncbi:hypothetical protein H7J07_04795 [Mycobacterium koreense]|nr:FtsK/SpoIIIE domain-containing protein [Mycolicibacillus koreensis]MCV7247575.1 hypothetical protein [Mycolicibacillus koreensis]BBY53954.1 hypothetical protein MKOR_12050 [Mycolicibacillus koreensis]